MGVPINVAIAVVLKNAPSLEPSFPSGVICPIAAGVTEMKIPEQKP